MINWQYFVDSEEPCTQIEWIKHVQFAVYTDKGKILRKDINSELDSGEYLGILSQIDIDCHCAYRWHSIALIIDQEKYCWGWHEFFYSECHERYVRLERKLRPGRLSSNQRHKSYFDLLPLLTLGDRNRICKKLGVYETTD